MGFTKMRDCSPVDEAYKQLQKIIESVKNIDLLGESEADARMKLIDPILREVLGWLPEQIKCEESIDGSRLDYILSTSTGGAVVEAKRPALIFDLETNKSGKKSYPLNGAVLRSGYTGDAITQAKEYAQKIGVSLAVATNGAQWVVFLASREDLVPPDKGFGFVFRSLEHMLEPDAFRDFFGLLGRSSVLSTSYKVAFYKVEGRLREPQSISAIRLITQSKGSDQRLKPSEISIALDPVIQQLFISMTPDRERQIIRQCFVTTRESDEADTRLKRLLDEVTDDIVSIDSRESQDHRLQAEIEQSVDMPDSRTVVLIGQIGSGKSTYLDRFFEFIIPVALKKKICLIRLNLENARPDKETFPSFLRKETIREVKKAVFGTDQPTFEQLKGAFYSLYQQMSRGEQKHLYESNRIQFDILFGNRLEEMKFDEEEYLRLILSHCNKSVKRLLVIIYDNVDHHSNEIQTLAFQQAQWLSGLGKVFSILPVRDSTYWQASAEGPFHTQTHVNLYLPRPPLNEVLTRRFKYAELQLDDLLAGKDVVLTSLKGIRVKVADPKELFQLLYKLFSSERYPNYLLRSLSGGNIRESLMLFYQTIISPHIPIDKLLAAYLAKENYRLGTVDKSYFDRAVILGPWAHFKQERSKNIVNLLCFPRDLRVSPILGLRIIERLYDLRAEVHLKAGKGYESIENLLAYFEALGVQRAVTEQCVTELISKKLLEPYDLRIFANPSIPISSELIEFVSLSYSGRLHRAWVRESKSYGLEMIRDMSIFNMDAANELAGCFSDRLAAIKVGKEKEKWTEVDRLLGEIASKTINYLSMRDQESMTIPTNDPLFSSQKSVFGRLLIWASNPKSKLFSDVSDDDGRVNEPNSSSIDIS